MTSRLVLFLTEISSDENPTDQAALFSAVVAAFTIDSYKWLQPDTADVTNILLATISLQLSDAPAAMGGRNFSSPAALVQNITNSFAPSQLSVNVNTLWITSLTFSLLAALFAISVQQWLRHLRLPSNLPLRTAFVLRQRLFVRLELWRIPVIISVLPVVLQVALISFLVGLLVFLRTINLTVANTFAVVATAGVGTFLTMTLLPLFSPSCVYRSPVVPTLIGLWHIVTLLIAIPCYLVVSLASLEHRVLRPISSKLYKSSLHRYAKDKAARARLHFSSFRRGAVVFNKPFWLDRDLRTYAGNAQHATDQALRDVIVNATFDPSAIALVRDAMLAYDPMKMARMILLSFVKSLSFSTVADVYDNLTSDLAGTEQFCHRATHCISASQIRMLMNTLRPERVSTVWLSKRFHNFFVYPLVCAHQAAKGASAEFRKSFCRYLWDLHIRPADGGRDLSSLRTQRLIPTATLILDSERHVLREVNCKGQRVFSTSWGLSLIYAQHRCRSRRAMGATSK